MNYFRRAMFQWLSQWVGMLNISKETTIERGFTHGNHGNVPGEQYFNGFRNGPGSYIFPRKSLLKEDLHTEAIELVLDNISSVSWMDLETICLLGNLSKADFTHGGHWTSPGEQYYNGFHNGSGSYIFPWKSSSEEDSRTEATELVQQGSTSMTFTMEREARKRTHLHMKALELVQASNISMVFIMDIEHRHFWGNPYQKRTYTRRLLNLSRRAIFQLFSRWIWKLYVFEEILIGRGRYTWRPLNKVRRAIFQWFSPWIG